MLKSHWLRSLFLPSVAQSRNARRRNHRRRTVFLAAARVELLEDRTLLSSYQFAVATSTFGEIAVFDVNDGSISATTHSISPTNDIAILTNGEVKTDSYRLHQTADGGYLEHGNYPTTVQFRDSSGTLLDTVITSIDEPYFAEDAAGLSDGGFVIQRTNSNDHNDDLFFYDSSGTFQGSVLNVAGTVSGVAGLEGGAVAVLDAPSVGTPSIDIYDPATRTKIGEFEYSPPDSFGEFDIAGLSNGGVALFGLVSPVFGDATETESYVYVWDSLTDTTPTEIKLSDYGVTAAGTAIGGDVFRASVTADANGPYQIDEGQSLTLDASGSTAGAGATYEWDVDGDGDFDENVGGETVTLTWPQLVALGLDDGPHTGDVTVRVTDGGSNTDSDIATLTIANVAPTISNVSNDGPVEQSEMVSVMVVADDPADSLTYEFDFDDNGSYEIAGSTGLASHAFSSLGTFRVNVRVSDGDGGTEIGFTDVVVQLPAPVLTAAPAVPPGTENTVSWSAVAGADEYLVQFDTDPNFGSPDGDSGWITGVSHTFTGLSVGEISYYRVKARQNAPSVTDSWTQTTQSDFATGVLAAVDISSTPGQVTLENRLREITGRIANPGFQTADSNDDPTGWSTHNDGFSGNEGNGYVEQNFFWSTEGTWAVSIASWASPEAAGDWRGISQQVDLTGVSQITFDALTLHDTWNNVEARVWIDDTVVWTGAGDDVEHLNQSIDVSALTGNHTLRMGLHYLGGSVGSEAVWFDNFKTSGLSGFVSSGDIVSPTINPSPLQEWDDLTFNATTPAGTGLSVDVLSSAGAVLASNVASGTDLSDLGITNTPIKLRANLSTADSSVAPALSDWAVSWTASPGVFHESGWSNVVSAVPDAIVTPYLQNPATDAMTIIWFTRTNTPGTLTVNVAGGGSQVFSGASTPELASELAYHTEEVDDLPGGVDPGPPYKHRLRITGLTAGTLYDYSVTQGAEIYEGQFRTIPTSDSSVRFMVYGDSETEPESTGEFTGWATPSFVPPGSTGRPAGRNNYVVDQTDGYFENLNLIESRNPDFIGIAGDLTESGGEQRDWDEFWRHNAGSLNDLAGSIPILAAPGNHENYGGPGVFGGYSDAAAIRARDKFSTYFEAPDNGSGIASYEDRYFRIDYGPITYISLDLTNGLPHGSSQDTNFFLGAGAGIPDFNPGSTQYQWLESQLADAQATSQFTFIQFHHVPYSVGPHGFPPGTTGQSNGTDTQSGVPVRILTPLFAQYGVDAVFAAHDEQYQHSLVDGVHFYDLGMGGDGLRGPSSGPDGTTGLPSTNPFQQFHAHLDAPEVWNGQQLVSGGKHYGHMEVDVFLDADGFWKAELEPVYNFPIMNASGDVIDWERRVYNDVVMLTNPAFDLSALDGTNGFQIPFVPGFAVSDAGDVNGDGFDEVIIGIPNIDRAIVVFGQAEGFPATLDPSTLDGTNGFLIDNLGPSLGVAVGGAGDINGDGFDDLIVGDPSAGDPGEDNEGGPGEAYVIFGTTSFPATFNVSSLDGTNGFRIAAEGPLGNGLGGTVSAAGDFNADGFADLLVNGQVNDGVFVVFGTPEGFPASISDAAIDGTNGFHISDVEVDGVRGISTAGDINGDGFDDLIIGDAFAGEAGEAYVIFGTSATVPSTFDVASLDGANGFRVIGTESFAGFALTVSGAGDLNGDGFDEILIGSRSADVGGAVDAGTCYVVFGTASGIPAVLDVNTLNGTNGFRINGANVNEETGRTVSGAFDINADGFDDLILGTDYSGSVHVVFGTAADFPAAFNLATLASEDGFRIDGMEIGRAVSGAGDVNGDGFDDVIIGVGHFTNGNTSVVFGGNFTGGAETQAGDATDNTITATQGAAVDILIGGGGNDTLISDGGDDVLRGAEGDDTLAIPDAQFSPRRLQGGNGFDTLRLDGSGITLDLTAIADNRITDIEQFDITGSGDNTLTFDVLEVLNLSTHSNTLIVRRDLGDVVNIGDGWTQHPNETIGTDKFNVFTQGAAVIKVEIVSSAGPSVLNVQINGGGNSNRSGIRELTFTFSDAVTIDGAAALRLFNHSTGLPVDLSNATLVGNGTASVTWDLSGVALDDGRYSAELPADAATPGLAATHAFAFHKLAGDANGDGVVSNSDYREVNGHFGSITGGAFRPGDANGDGVVSNSDYREVNGRFGTVLATLSLDFGDAPGAAAFPTTLADDGARHVLTANNLFLGASRDAETNGQSSADAGGDDAAGMDDENGLTIGDLERGSTVSVAVTANVPAGAVLNGWIDWNADGDWDDAGEQVFTNVPLSSGPNDLDIEVPAAATPGPTTARFRLTQTPGYSYFGLAPNGEVEDYQVTVTAPPEIVQATAEPLFAASTAALPEVVAPATLTPPTPIPSPSPTPTPSPLTRLPAVIPAFRGPQFASLLTSFRPSRTLSRLSLFTMAAPGRFVLPMLERLSTHTAMTSFEPDSPTIQAVAAGQFASIVSPAWRDRMSASIIPSLLAPVMTIGGYGEP